MSEAHRPLRAMLGQIQITARAFPGFFMVYDYEPFGNLTSVYKSCCRRKKSSQTSEVTGQILSCVAVGAGPLRGRDFVDRQYPP
jgi:hypothetical protein